MNEDWFTFKVGEKIRVSYVVASLDGVVDEQSACSFWGNPDVEELADRDHISCVKPTGPTDLGFLILKNFVLSDPLESRRFEKTGDVVIDGVITKLQALHATASVFDSDRVTALKPLFHRSAFYSSREVRAILKPVGITS